MQTEKRTLKVRSYPGGAPSRGYLSSESPQNCLVRKRLLSCRPVDAEDRLKINGLLSKYHYKFSHSARSFIGVDETDEAPLLLPNPQIAESCSKSLTLRTLSTQSSSHPAQNADPQSIPALTLRHDLWYVLVVILKALGCRFQLESNVLITGIHVGAISARIHTHTRSSVQR